jgi:translation initiation factor 1
MTNSNSKLVYSTEKGRICPDCSRPVKKCACRHGNSRSQADQRLDSILRIRRETKGRGGKTVTAISGLAENYDVTKKLASKLKNLCGSGGSVKGSVILIQGDHREVVKTELEKQGFKVKLSGG